MGKCFSFNGTLRDKWSQNMRTARQGYSSLLFKLVCVVTAHCLVVSAFVNLSRRVAVQGPLPSNYAVKPLCCPRALGSSLSLSSLGTQPLFQCPQQAR
jgi:hypothetical protein